jgi:hypothetical protein
MTVVLIHEPNFFPVLLIMKENVHANKVLLDKIIYIHNSGNNV